MFLPRLLRFFHALIFVWFVCNEERIFKGISLRIKAQSGAIEPTSRKGVGPGLWRMLSKVIPETAPVPEPYV